MKDFDKLKKTFGDMRIKYTEETFKEKDTAEYAGDKIDYNQYIKLDRGIGYFGFECIFYFLDGKSTGHRVWE